jgi:hypothetical protein
VHFRDHPLLNTPHLVVVILRAADRGADVEDCARRLESLLERTDEHPPVSRDELRARLDRLRRQLTRARLLTPVEDHRFTLTDRGREALAEHPAGFDTADLMRYREFADGVHRAAQSRADMDPRARGYDEGFHAYWSGKDATDNPYRPDTVDHLAWENGWSEALDEDRR